MNKEDVLYTQWNTTRHQKQYLAIFDNMDGPAGYYVKLNELEKVSQRKTNVIWFHLHVESKGEKKKNTKQKQPIGIENKLMVAKGEEHEGRGKIK